jgi:hypothetical protein
MEKVDSSERFFWLPVRRKGSFSLESEKSGGVDEKGVQDLAYFRSCGNRPCWLKRPSELKRKLQKAGARRRGCVLYFSQAIGTAQKHGSCRVDQGRAGEIELCDKSATLTISKMVISGTNSADFRFTTRCGSSLGVGASCGVTITFTPGAKGTRTATLTTMAIARVPKPFL